MSTRLFEKKDHAKIYVENRPSPPPSLLKFIMDFLQEKYTGELSCAVDLGCGSGQCTEQISDLHQFTKVLGTDISSAQIEAATDKFSGRKSMQFLVSPSEQIPLKDESVQLITSCAAAHWFDLPKVYEEGRRVLCENGVMAFTCYLFPTYEWNCPSGDLLDKAIQQVFDEIDESWAPGPQLANDKYIDVIIPYRDYTRAEGFTSERLVGISSITGLYESLSAFQTMCETKGHDVGERIINNLHDTLHENIGDKMVKQKFTYFVVLARK